MALWSTAKLIMEEDRERRISKTIQGKVFQGKVVFFFFPARCFACTVMFCCSECVVSDVMLVLGRPLLMIFSL